MGTVSRLPAILDIRDDLNRALDETGGDDDLAAEIDSVIDRLEAFAERDAADRGGIVDEIDNQLLRVEERLNQDDSDGAAAAARDIQSARNRLHIYRQNRDETAENLSVIDSGVRQHDDDEAVTAGALPVGEATLTVTVANTGDDTEVVPIVTFYDEESDELESVRGPEFALAGGAQEQFEMEMDTPADATSYAVAVSDTGEERQSV